MPNFDFHSNVINHDRLSLLITNEKFVVYVKISNLLKAVHELDLFHRFIGKHFLNKKKKTINFSSKLYLVMYDDVLYHPYVL
jgi:hypothetical protein